jgi:hypothetical protein
MNFGFGFSVLLLAGLFASCSSLPPEGGPAAAHVSRSPSSEYRPSEAKLLRELNARIHRVEEFKALREWGKANGVRVWGAGGTATGLATYIQQHLENEERQRHGLERKYFDGRFSYSYFDIYRSTQDADIVIDGTEEDAKKLEAFLKENFNYLEGSKEIWEVRLLNHSRGSGAGEKDPLLDFDFQNQNSDSFSTGMVEITDPPKGEARVRDLFDWKNHRRPRYLRDLVERQLTFYRNPNHFSTKRAKAGINPEILSAIRALTKSFQYESALRPEAEAEIRSIVENWDPAAPTDSYTTGQVSKNGMKLFWHSPDVERAWDELERIGLRKKLITFGKRGPKTDLAIWLDREPLRTRPLGTSGITARELGIDVIAHETGSFLAYENISRSLRGKPNVFTSRKGAPGETAVHGDGFYTRIGRVGARNTGITIRFTLHPDAREGTDFTKVGDFVIVKNASAIRVIDESLNITLVEYYHLLANGEFKGADKGMLEKLKFRLKGSARVLTPKEDAAIARIIATRLREAVQQGNRDLLPVFSDWLRLPGAHTHGDLLEVFLRHYRESDLFQFPVFWGRGRIEAWVEREMRRLSMSEFLRNILNRPVIFNHPKFGEWVDQVMDIHISALPSAILYRPELVEHPKYVEWVERVMKAHPVEVIDNVLGGSHLRGNSKFVASAKYSEWIERALALDPVKTANKILRAPEVMQLPKYSQWVDQLVRTHPREVAVHILSVAESAKHPKFADWVDQVMKTETQATATYVLTKTAVLANHPQYATWVDLAMAKSPHAVAVNVLSKPEFLIPLPKFTAWVDQAVASSPEAVATYVLNQLKIVKHPKYVEWVDHVVREKPAVVAHTLLGKQGLLGDHPKFGEWVDEVVRRDPIAIWHNLFEANYHASTPHPKLDRWILSLIRALPGINADSLIKRILKANQGALLQRLCPPPNSVTTQCLRKRLEHGHVLECSNLLRTYLPEGA